MAISGRPSPLVKITKFNAASMSSNAQAPNMVYFVYLYSTACSCKINKNCYYNAQLFMLSYNALLQGERKNKYSFSYSYILRILTCRFLSSASLISWAMVSTPFFLSSTALPEVQFMNVQFRWGFSGIILRVLRLEVSVYNGYITNHAV